MFNLALCFLTALVRMSLFLFICHTAGNTVFPFGTFSLLIATTSFAEQFLGNVYRYSVAAVITIILPTHLPLSVPSSTSPPLLRAPPPLSRPSRILATSILTAWAHTHSAIYRLTQDRGAIKVRKLRTGNVLRARSLWTNIFYPQSLHI